MYDHIYMYNRVTALNSHVEVLLHYCLNVFHENNQQITILLIDLHRGETRDHQSQLQT